MKKRWLVPVRPQLASRLGRWQTVSGARLAACLFVVVAASLGAWLAQPAPLVALDQQQHRFDHLAPVPQGTRTVGQTFVAGHNGLSAIEVLAAVHPDPSPDAALQLSLKTAIGETVAVVPFTNLTHNESIRLNFAPQPQSRGQTYELLISAEAGNPATVWAYSLDGYHHGTMTDAGAPTQNDLLFSTFYTYLWPDLARDMAGELARCLPIAVPLWLLLFAPGLLLLDTVWPQPRQQPRSLGLRWGSALALSLSVLPVLWLWTTVAGVRLSAAGLMVLYGSLGLAVIARHSLRLRKWWFSTQPAERLGGWRPSPHWLLLILFFSLLVRVVAIRDLAFPPWVDSPHHATIVQLMATSGQVPQDFQPILPVDEFIYHFGFHALAVAVHWLTGLSIPQVLLGLGQVLNALAPLAVYTFVVTVTGRFRVGLWAAFFVGIVSQFPAYYVSWGRYSQLTGLLILGPALSAFWQLIPRRSMKAAPGSGRQAWIAPSISAGLLATGLLLTHYRLAVFFAIFCLVGLASGGRGGWKLALAAALGGGLFALPWLLRLGTQAVLPAIGDPGTIAAEGDYNAFPVAYFSSTLERGWMILAVLGAVWGLWRRRRAVWVVAGWTAVTFALLNIGSGTWIVNNNSWAITLFLPGALMFGWSVDQWLVACRLLRRPGHQAWQVAVSFAMLAGLASLAGYAGLRGAAAQVAIVNPITLLGWREDVPALAWAEKNVSAGSVFAISSWEWSRDAWSGSDGGIWLLTLTGQQTTTPPLSYLLGVEEWRQTVNGLNAKVASLTDANAPEALALLRESGISHIYIGARGGNLRPEMFVSSPHYRLLYTNGAAWIFEVIDTG